MTVVRLAFLVSALVLIAPSVVRAAIPEGTYSNVCIHGETGDLLGVELQMKRNAGKPAIQLWICEGGCGQPYPISEISAHDNQITFNAADRDYFVSGALAHMILHSFTATLRGNFLVLESPGYLPERQKLQKRPPKAAIGKPETQPMPVHSCR